MHLEASLETGFCLWLMINTKLRATAKGCIAKVSQSSLCFKDTRFYLSTKPFEAI